MAVFPERQVYTNNTSEQSMTLGGMTLKEATILLDSLVRYTPSYKEGYRVNTVHITRGVYLSINTSIKTAIDLP